MRYVYGPVPSRRLGFSLGVDVVPYKTCSLDCIYCQLGRTRLKTVGRKPYTQEDAVRKEIKEALAKKQSIDYITFAGSGEPTLNSDIGALIRETKRITSLPVVVLTNGTLLFREDVRRDLAKADIVMPSLDAASQKVFENVNRPHKSLHIGTIIDGLKKFRGSYKGQIWLEIMLVKDFNNDGAELLLLKKAVSKICPDKIYLNTVVRPPSEIYAKPLSQSEMISVKNFFDQSCEVITEFHRQRVEEANNVEEAIIDMAQRRPLTIEDIANVLGVSTANAEEYVNGLKKSGKLKERQYKEEKYYSYATEK
jgi:wyosine [tRNA(Phe)-imidazoG37] synthetase (radical SAM superfamily)